MYPLAQSTGPRTEAGKARSRFNALKHTLDAREDILPGEDSEARAELSAAYRDEHRPVGPTQSFLVEVLAQRHWERMRYTRAKVQIVKAACAGMDPADQNLAAILLKDPATTKLLDKVERRLDRTHRDYMQALTAIHRLQKERAESESLQPDPEPEPISGPAALPPAPVDIIAGESPQPNS